MIKTIALFPEPGHDATAQSSDVHKAMFDATPDCVKIITTGGRLLAMNRAGRLALGVGLAAPLGMPWLGLLPESVRAEGETALRDAAAGRSARFAGQSVTDAGVIYWDNLLTPVTDDCGRVTSIVCVSRDVTDKVRLEREIAAAMAREQLISGEMQHRIKNLFAIVSSLISISEKDAARAGAPGSTVSLLRERLGALIRATDCAFDADTAPASDMSVALHALVTAVLRPYGERCVIGGDNAQINRRDMTTLALFLHELATNSVKYGALSADAGEVRVHWSQAGDKLQLVWRERGGPAISGPPTRLGFGAQMIDRIIQSARGTITRDWANGGLCAELRLPCPAIPAAA